MTNRFPTPDSTSDVRSVSTSDSKSVSTSDSKSVSTSDAVDARSVWVSSVIPGLTVQVIDPMPPGAGEEGAEDSGVQDSGAGEERAVENSAADSERPASPRTLNRLKPRTDARSRHRRSRLLRLRQEAVAAKTSAGPPAPAREIDSGHASEPPDSGQTKQGPRTTDKTEPRVTAQAGVDSPADRAGLAASHGECVVADDGDSSDEVVSVLRSELTGPLITGAITDDASEDLLSDHLPVFDIKASPPDSPAESRVVERPPSLTRERRHRRARRPQGARRPVGASVKSGAESGGKAGTESGMESSMESAAEERYADWFRRVVLRHRWMSVFTTFYIHWLILLLLGMMVVHGPENAAALILNGTFTPAEETQTEAFDITIPEPVPDSADDEERTPETRDDSVRELLHTAATERSPELDEGVMQSLLSGLAPTSAAPTHANSAHSADAATDAGAAATRQNPAPPRAVSEGSFSVWTEPAAPVADEPYRIIIQIRLPEGVARCHVNDLEGVVVGSDGYRKPIPGHLTGLLPVEGGYARLVVPIVSADERVRDTVLIRSKQLKESQRLTIAFEAAR